MTGLSPTGRQATNGRRRPLGRGSLGVSAGVHAIVLVVVFWAVPALRPDPVFFRAVEMNMVAAAPAAEEQLVVETPDEPEPAPAEAEPSVIEEEPEPDSLDSPPPADEEPPPAPAASVSDTEEPEDGDDEVTVRIEGFRRDFPEYYENITNQIKRCFRPPERAGRRPVVVRFHIHLDGSITDIDVGQTSGSFSFDTEAMGAVECAGKPGRLGPLPAEYRWEVLPIDFTISPKGGPMDDMQQGSVDAC